MKKLDAIIAYSGNKPPDAWLIDMHRAVNHLIDLVNSQQEAIERLQDHVDHEARHVSEPADDKPEYKLPGTEEVIEKLDKATLRPKLVDSISDDTHRTVTLRIPKGKRIGQAISNAAQGDPLYISDTDLQKALDEVQPNE